MTVVVVPKKMSPKHQQQQQQQQHQQQQQQLPSLSVLSYLVSLGFLRSGMARSFLIFGIGVWVGSTYNQTSTSTSSSSRDLIPLHTEWQQQQLLVTAAEAAAGGWIPPLLRSSSNNNRSNSNDSKSEDSNNKNKNDTLLHHDDDDDDNNNNNKHDGWHTIHVYYGDTSLLDERDAAFTSPSSQHNDTKVDSSSTTNNLSNSNSNQTSSSSSFSNHSWFSQARQDELVWRLLGSPDNGYFVDLAANDAQQLSNTYALERFHDWKGLCIEPNPQYWYHLSFRPNCHIVGAVVGSGSNNQQQQEQRQATPPSANAEARTDQNEAAKQEHNPEQEHQQKNNVTGSSSTNKKELQRLHFRFEAGDHGGIAGDGFDNGKRWQSSSVPVVAVPLLEIFERMKVPHTIDYLSLDVEGAESFILMGFPFDKYHFKIITAERLRGPIRAYLNQHGYRFIRKLTRWGESLWIHESLLLSPSEEEGAEQHQEQQQSSSSFTGMVNLSIIDEYAFPL